MATGRYAGRKGGKILDYYIHKTEEEKNKIREVGSAATDKLREALKALKKAKRWAMLDIFGGRRIATSIKQKHMAIAKSHILEVKHELEQSDKVFGNIVYLLGTTGLDTQGFIGEIDYLRHDYYVDTEIWERIKGVIALVNQAIDKIEALYVELEHPIGKVSYRNLSAWS